MEPRDKSGRVGGSATVPKAGQFGRHADRIKSAWDALEKRRHALEDAKRSRTIGAADYDFARQQLEREEQGLRKDAQTIANREINQEWEAERQRIAAHWASGEINAAQRDLDFERLAARMYTRLIDSGKEIARQARGRQDEREYREAEARLNETICAASPVQEANAAEGGGPTARAEPKERIHVKSQVEAMGRSADPQQDFDAFVMSAKGKTSTSSFQQWAGGERVTLAIVFTDVVGSTPLGEEIRDEAMDKVRRAHFAQSRKLIGRFTGREIKTIGDSVMAAFKCVDSALDYAIALQENTGHPQVRIRAGIHIGPMQVEESDVFGGTVNFAARVVGAIKDAEIWLSESAKKDIDRLGAARHKGLGWERHDGVAMKGFPDVFTLWSLEKPPR